MSLLVQLSLTHPLLFTNHLNNSEYYILQTPPNSVEILRLGCTLKIKVLQSINSRFPLATQKLLKIFLKSCPKYSKNNGLDNIF